MSLRAENVRLDVPGRCLIDALNIEFKPGECWAILGCNGSGKSSLLHALAGLQAPASGTVRWQDTALTELPRREVAQKIGLLLQAEANSFWGTVQEWVALGRYPHGDFQAAKLHARDALRQVDMLDFASRRMDSLSGGERQRVRLALLLAQDPAVYMLDEPMQHLDVRHQAACLALVNDLMHAGKTVLLVLHEPHYALQVADHALLLEGVGVPEYGSAQDLLTAERLSRLYRCPIAAYETGAGRVFLPTSLNGYTEAKSQ